MTGGRFAIAVAVDYRPGTRLTGRAVKAAFARAMSRRAASAR